MDSFITELKKELAKPLPGIAAQHKMSSITRRYNTQAPDNAREAGVLALFYPKDTDWHLIFIERVANKKDRHSGQISFPGGKVDPTDPSYAYTALREAEEEVGVAANSINLLGNLTNLYIPVSNFLVHPFVGYLDHTPTFQAQESEVQALLETPFSTFLKEETIKRKTLHINQYTLRDVPHYEVKDKIIWGATAMMMSELVEVARQPALR